jgi:putative heme-binding domain-containing protein
MSCIIEAQFTNGPAVRVTFRPMRPCTPLRQSFRPWLLLVVAAVITAVPAAPQHVEQNPFSSAEDLAEGQKLYILNCVACHGPHGNSGRGYDGAKLATKQRKHGNSDGEMFQNILNGIPGTSMPGAWLDDEAVWKILLFIRTFEPDTERACLSSGGDLDAGHELFVGAGRCAVCHTVGMGGGRLGPDLSNAGMVYTKSQIRDALLDPNKTIAEGHRALKVVLRTGDSHEGVLLNEGDYSLHMMGRDEEIYSFMKQDLVSLQRLSRSLMPAYGDTFSKTELENLTAYLCNLGGEHP